MESDDILQSVYSQDLIAERKAIRMAAYEEKIIKRILTHAGLIYTAPIMANKTKERTGKARLTFDVFYEYYPNFPIYLNIRKVPFAYQINVTDLFNKFCSTPIFQTWENFLDEVPVEDKAVGLVFDWPGIQGTNMILHNYDTSIDFENRVRIVRNVGRGRNAQPITVEQFEPFLASVLQIWVPS